MLFLSLAKISFTKDLSLAGPDAWKNISFHIYQLCHLIYPGHVCAQERGCWACGDFYTKCTQCPDMGQSYGKGMVAHVHVAKTTVENPFAPKLNPHEI